MKKKNQTNYPDIFPYNMQCSCTNTHGDEAVEWFAERAEYNNNKFRDILKTNIQLHKTIVIPLTNKGYQYERFNWSKNKIARCI